MIIAAINFFLFFLILKAAGNVLHFVFDETQRIYGIWSTLK